MTDTVTYDEKRTAKDPEAYVAKLKTNPMVVEATIVSIDGETKSGQKRYTLRLTIAR